MIKEIENGIEFEASLIQPKEEKIYTFIIDTHTGCERGQHYLTGTFTDLEDFKKHPFRNIVKIVKQEVIFEVEESEEAERNRVKDSADRQRIARLFPKD